MLSGARGEGAAMALRIVADTARLMSAPSLIPVQSAHIDGALYHGDSGTLFAERLVELGAKVSIRATLNVGGLDLMGCSKVNLPPHEREMAGRMMRAYIALGCEPTWTCAPYQAGHRPALGSDVAWGESNAVVFCNSVLGARTNRYGDFLDIACAISGRAPNYGLHLAENRRATFAVDVSALPAALLTSEIAFPVLGSLFGRLAGTSVGVVTGIAAHPGEDALKAFGAAAASTGGVGLFHILGVTPEAPDMDTATGGGPLRETIQVSADHVHRNPAPPRHRRARRPYRRRRHRQPASVGGGIRQARGADRGPQTCHALLRLHRPPRLESDRGERLPRIASKPAASPSSPTPASSSRRS